MTNFDPTEHPRESAGRFTDKNHSEPELNLGSSWEEMFAADQRAAVDAEGYVFVNSGTDLPPAEVFEGADGVIIGTNSDGLYVATAEFTNLDMVHFASTVTGVPAGDDPDELNVAWLNKHADEIEEFLTEKGIESDGTEWDAERFTVTVPLDQDDVTFSGASDKLFDSVAAQYLAESLSSQEGLMARDMRARFAPMPLAA